MSHHPALRSEPPLPWSARTLAGMLAIVVHVLFFVVLVLSVNWHSEDTAPVAVEMWSPSTLRASMAGAVPPTPLPPAPQPVVPQPAPQPVVPQPAPTPPSPPQPEPVPSQRELAPTPNPDIALAQARAKAKQEKAAQLADEAWQQAQHIKKLHRPKELQGKAGLRSHPFYRVAMKLRFDDCQKLDKHSRRRRSLPVREVATASAS